MVLNVVSNEGDVMSPIFFPDGLIFGAKEYIKLLTTKIKPWMGEMANGREYVFCRILPPPTRQGLHKHGCTLMSPITGPLTFGLPPPQTVILWTITYGASWRRKSTKGHTTPRMS